jgi:hypothetical protein
METQQKNQEKKPLVPVDIEKFVDKTLKLLDIEKGAEVEEAFQLQVRIAIL